MQNWQANFLIVFAIFNAFVFAKGFHESKNRKNAYGMTYPLFPLSIFVWGDAVVFGFFWAMASVTALILNDWILFLLLVSLFYLVRSIGETVYWLNQQFSPIVRCEPKNYWTHKIFHNDSVWFVFQTMHQCITVVTIVTSLYLAKMWLNNI